jgi:hypothetical protein
MPTLLKAEPLTEEQIRELCREWREQQAQHDPEMRMFVRRPPLWRRLLAKLQFYLLTHRGKSGHSYRNSSQ